MACWSFLGCSVSQKALPLLSSESLLETLNSTYGLVKKLEVPFRRPKQPCGLIVPQKALVMFRGYSEADTEFNLQVLKPWIRRVTLYLYILNNKSNLN